MTDKIMKECSCGAIFKKGRKVHEDLGHTVKWKVVKKQ